MTTNTRKRNGQYFTCPYCDEEFYRRPSHVRRGITKTCGKRECISKSAMGENNAYWGKTHSPEIREQLSKTRRARPADSPARKYGPAKGAFKHTPEARAAISESLRKQWKENRDMRLAATQKSSETQKMNAINGEPRYRLQFTPMQRRDWKDEACLWCDSKDDLVLDHILPVMAGGTNVRENAQTLCRTCNLWKMRYLDRPLMLAILACRGAT